MSSVAKTRKVVASSKKELFNLLKKDLKTGFSLPKQADKVDQLMQWFFVEPPKGSSNNTRHVEHYAAFVQYAKEAGLTGQLKLYNLCCTLETMQDDKKFNSTFQSKIVAAKKDYSGGY